MCSIRPLHFKTTYIVQNLNHSIQGTGEIDRYALPAIILKLEMGNVSKRQLPDQRADNSRNICKNMNVFSRVCPINISRQNLY